MRNLAFLILFLFSIPQLAYSYDVLVLLSRRDPVFDEAVNGFRQKHKFKERTIILSDYTDIDVVRLIKEDRPGVVLAVGDTALSVARKSRTSPVVSLMALSLNRKGSFPFVTGVEFHVKPEQIMQLFQVMKAQKIGVLYDSEKNGDYMRRAQAAASRSGLHLIARDVASVKDVINGISELKGNVDAIWMIPDSTAVNKRTMEAFYLFSLGQQIPIITFDRSHLASGAAVAVEPDREEMGLQAAEMVAALLDGTSESSLFSSVSPRKVIMKTSPSVIKLLNINSSGIERLSTSWK